MKRYAKFLFLVMCILAYFFKKYFFNFEKINCNNTTFHSINYTYCSTFHSINDIMGITQTKIDGKNDVTKIDGKNDGKNDVTPNGTQRICEISAKNAELIARMSVDDFLSEMISQCAIYITTITAANLTTKNTFLINAFKNLQDAQQFVIDQNMSITPRLRCLMLMTAHLIDLVRFSPDFNTERFHQFYTLLSSMSKSQDLINL